MKNLLLFLFISFTYLAKAQCYCGRLYVHVPVPDVVFKDNKSNYKATITNKFNGKRTERYSELVPQVLVGANNMAHLSIPTKNGVEKVVVKLKNTTTKKVVKIVNYKLPRDLFLTVGFSPYSLKKEYTLQWDEILKCREEIGIRQVGTLHCNGESYMFTQHKGEFRIIPDSSANYPSQRYNTTVRPVKKAFFKNDTLSFVFNELISIEESKNKKPIWGALKRTENGWDTLIDVRSLEKTHRAPSATYNNYKRDFVVIGSSMLWTDDKLYPNEYLLNQDGEYKLTILCDDRTGDANGIVYSEPFSISTKTILDAKLGEELKLSPDTLSIGENQFKLEANVWRDLSQLGGGSPVISYTELQEINHSLPEEMILKKQYVIHGNEIWIEDYGQIKRTKQAIETRIDNGPKWREGATIDVVCEFEYLGKIHRVIARSKEVFGVQ